MDCSALKKHKSYFTALACGGVATAWSAIELVSHTPTPIIESTRTALDVVTIATAATACIIGTGCGFDERKFRATFAACALSTVAGFSALAAGPFEIHQRLNALPVLDPEAPYTTTAHQHFCVGETKRIKVEYQGQTYSLDCSK